MLMITTCFSNSLQNLIKSLEDESKTALSWLNKNNTIANPGKFHAIFVTKNRNGTSNLKINIGDKLITSEPCVKFRYKD